MNHIQIQTKFQEEAKASEFDYEKFYKEYIPLLKTTSENFKQANTIDEHGKPLPAISFMGCAMQGKTTVVSFLRGDKLQATYSEDEDLYYVTNPDEGSELKI